MNSGSPISLQVFALVSFLSLTWGTYLMFTLREFRAARNSKKGRVEMMALYRRSIVAICVFMLPFSLLVRTSLVLMGLGDQLAGQVVFYAFAGTNIPGSIFVALTVLKPEWFD